MTTILNLIAVLVSPLFAVKVSQYLQNKEQSRKDKMQIFQCLMTYRKIGWATLGAVNALNSIDIIFSDSQKVLDQFHTWQNKCKNTTSLEDIYEGQCKLLQAMADELGYKDKITWDIIQDPYYPDGLAQQIEKNTQIQNIQYTLSQLIAQMAPQMVAQMMPQMNKQENPEDTKHTNT